MPITPDLNALLDRAAFDGLAITKTPAGTFAVSVLNEAGWSPDVTRGTVCEALLVALGVPFSVQLMALPPCPVALPPCPVSLPA